LTPVQKTAAFLLLVGFERGSNIMSWMDSREISKVAAEIGKITEMDLKTQQNVWDEFKRLGYNETMNAAEALDIIRLLFNGRNISDKM